MLQTIEEDTYKGMPAALTLIREIVNTKYGSKRPDDWQSSEQVRKWLIEHHLLDQSVPVSQGDQRRLIEVREAVRDLLRSNNGTALAPEQLETLNHIAAHAPIIVQFRLNGEAQLVPDIAGVDGVISLLLGNVFTAMQEESWNRLKICHNDACNVAFYDTSKNHSGTWCTMAKCGSRSKARAYRKRQQTEAPL